MEDTRPSMSDDPAAATGKAPKSVKFATMRPPKHSRRKARNHTMPAELLGHSSSITPSPAQTILQMRVAHYEQIRPDGSLLDVLKTPQKRQVESILQAEVRKLSPNTRSKLLDVPLPELNLGPGVESISRKGNREYTPLLRDMKERKRTESHDSSIYGSHSGVASGTSSRRFNLCRKRWSKPKSRNERIERAGLLILDAFHKSTHGNAYAHAIDDWTRFFYQIWHHTLTRVLFYLTIIIHIIVPYVLSSLENKTTERVIVTIYALVITLEILAFGFAEVLRDPHRLA
ncbi:hypothetical protein AAMO2058_001643600, partial [Amorphochlora amoebiformis]